MRRFAVGILLALILPLSACTVYDGDYGHGGYYSRPYPPPSYGDWRWDDDLRVYANVGYPNIYYHDHVYYRWYGDRWSSASGFRGPWRVIEHRHVPPRLGQRYYPRPHYDYRRDHDRYDSRDRYDYRDRRDYRNDRDYRERRDWQNRDHDDRPRDRDRDDGRWERRDERYGERFQEQPRRLLQQFGGRDLDSQPQRFVRPQGSPAAQQWQQPQPRQRPVGQQQLQERELRREQRVEQRRQRQEQVQLRREQAQQNREQRQRTAGVPPRQEHRERPASGQRRGQEQGWGAGAQQWESHR